MVDDVAKYLADINRLWEPYTMTEEEAAYFQRERAAQFVPLTPEQMQKGLADDAIRSVGS